MKISSRIVRMPWVTLMNQKNAQKDFELSKESIFFQQKTKKSLGRAIAFLIILATYMGVTSTPAVAVEDPNAPSWDIEVEVTDTSPPGCEPSWEPASWNPELFVEGTDVDMANPTSVEFEVFLMFSRGIAIVDCDGSPGPGPSGTVTASFSGDPELNLDALDCQSNCYAWDLFTEGVSPLEGTISVNAGTLEGTYTGTLTVIWAPDLS
jgi:hypothetical protein